MHLSTDENYFLFSLLMHPPFSKWGVFWVFLKSWNSIFAPQNKFGDSLKTNNMEDFIVWGIYTYVFHIYTELVWVYVCMYICVWFTVGMSHKWVNLDFVSAQTGLVFFGHCPPYEMNVTALHESRLSIVRDVLFVHDNFVYRVYILWITEIVFYCFNHWHCCVGLIILCVHLRFCAERSCSMVHSWNVIILNAVCLWTLCHVLTRVTELYDLRRI